MRSFYLVLLLLSGVFLLLELMARVFFGRTLIPDSGVLFERKKSRLEWQTVFPKNMLRLIIFVFISALLGLLLDLAGFVGWISMPLAAVGGLAFNFALNMAIAPLYFKLNKSGAPKPAQLEGMDGTVTEDITADEYGTIRVRCGKRSYYFAGATANGRPLPAGTQVIIIYSEDGLCFAESAEHFYDILFEDEEEPT